MGTEKGENRGKINTKNKGCLYIENPFTPNQHLSFSLIIFPLFSPFLSTKKIQLNI